jgi:hypothetical protein
MIDQPKTRPGQMSSEEAEKIASGLYKRMHSEDKAPRNLLVQWWVADSLIILCISAVLFTGVPILGRVQWVNEAQAQQKEANEQVKSEVNQRFDKLERKVDSQGDILTGLATASLRADICRYVARRVKETDSGERLRLLEQIELLKRKYFSYSREIFNTSDC